MTIGPLVHEELFNKQCKPCDISSVSTLAVDVYGHLFPDKKGLALYSIITPLKYHVFENGAFILF